MLKKVEFLDYESSYAYSISSGSALINTDEIVKATQIAPENTRSSYEIVRVWFRNGSHLDVVGKVEDLLDG